MSAILRNLALIFIGSLLGATTVVGYLETRPTALLPTPAGYSLAHAATLEGRLTMSEDTVAEIYQRLSPAVVNITNLRSTGSSSPGGAFPERGVGSGVIIDDRGDILTNNHVVDRADALEVTLADGTRTPATLLGRDPGNDLAVIKIELSDSLRSKIAVAPLGDSDTLKPGQAAIAIGNPFGFRGSITGGIISSLGRTFSENSSRPIRNMIQTDAAINPGNSGGPLIDSTGEVIGINTAIESPVRGSVGVGFAIPINTARQLLGDMLAGKTISHAWLGVSIVSASSDMAVQAGAKSTNGVYVIHVQPGSPAEKAGIKGAISTRASQNPMGGTPVIPSGGDVILAIDGRQLSTADELNAFLDAKQVGDTVTMAVLRDDKQIEVQAVLDNWPDSSG